MRLNPTFRRAMRVALIGLMIPGVIGLAGCKRKTPQDRLDDARELIQESQVSIGILKLGDLVSTYPDDPAAIDARLTLAEVHMRSGQRGNMEKAIKELTAVYEKLGFTDQRGLMAHRTVTNIYFQLGEFDKAVAHSADSLVRAGNDASMKEQLEILDASMHLALDDEAQQAKGRETLEQKMEGAAEEMSRHQSREILADYFRSKGKWEESNAVYQKWIDAHPDDRLKPQLLMAMALNYRRMNQEEKAKEVFTEGAAAQLAAIDAELDLNKRGEMLKTQATFYETFGDLESAEKIYLRIMSDLPRTRAAIEAQFAIGETYARAGNWDTAQATFEQILKENTGNEGMIQMAQQYIDRVAQAREGEKEMKAKAAADAATSPTLSQEATTTAPPPEAPQP